MNQRMRKAAWLQRAASEDEWGEVVESWQETGEAAIALSTSTGATERLNSVQGISSTHVALTRDARPAAGDRLSLDGRTYRVDFVIGGTRYHQLYLNGCDVL